MSLILEALRKSEAERRRAQVPDLLTEAQATTPSVARAAPRWPMWLGSAVVAVAAVWFVMSRNADAPPAQDTTVARDRSVADLSVTPPTVDDVAAREPAPARPAPALQRPLVVAAPAPAVPAEARPTPATATRPPSSTDNPPQPLAATPAARPVPPRAEPVASAPPPPAPMASAPAVERLADLGSAERKQLPPLKLSMHMWNDVAAQRVVIIDGTRLGVGDRIGAVVVADIVPDGVLLDWNGRALKLPLR